MRRDVIILFCTVFAIVNTCVVLYLADYRNKCCSQLVIVSSDFVESRGEQRFSGNWLPGCQDVCYFRTEDLKPNSQAVTHVLGEGELNLTSVLAQSPELGEASEDGLLVYNVLPGTPNHPWRTIIQSASLDSPPKEDSIIHVVVVNKDNVVLVYNTDVKNSDNDTSENPEPAKKLWSPKEVSLVYQNELALTEIAWEERSSGGVYHVTWEVDGGGLKGHLFTDATRVTLNLWPETTYHVQVEMVSRTPDTEMDKSEPLTINTSRSKHLTEARDEMEFETTRDLLTNFESSMRKEDLSNRTSYSSFVLGCLAALCVFSASVAVTILWWHRRERYTAKAFRASSPVLLSEKVTIDIPPLQTLEGGFRCALRDGEHW